MKGDPAAFRCVLRPALEGANIHVWLGFKHVLYLVEEAVARYLADRGYGVARLYRECGLAFELVSCRLRLSHVISLDDEVQVDLVPTGPAAGLGFSARLSLRRNGGLVRAASGATVALLRGHDPAAAPGALPSDIAHVVAAGPPADPSVASVELSDRAPAAALLDARPRASVTSLRVPYWYCHYSSRMRFSGYARVLEAVVDGFLEERGLGVAALLQRRSWIPVVAEVALRVLGDAHMDETLHTSVAVDEVFKDLLYTATMFSYVRRRERLVPVAHARIIHGYAEVRGPDDWRLTALDADVIAALQR